MEEQYVEAAGQIQVEHQTSQAPTEEKANTDKFREPRGWSVHWCGFALSSADRSTGETTDEEC